MRPAFYRCGRLLARVHLRLWHRYDHTGVERVPAEGPVLLVANHSSFLDPLLVGSPLRRLVHFMARRSLQRIPVLGWLLPRLGTILVDRDAPRRDELRRAAAVLERGGVLCLFPEGRRSPDGRVQPFKRGLELLLRQAPQTRIVPVGVSGSDRALGRGHRWPRPRRLAVHYGTAWTAADVRAAGGLERLRHEVARLAGRPVAPPGGSDGAAGGRGADPGCEAPARGGPGRADIDTMGPSCAGSGGADPAREPRPRAGGLPPSPTRLADPTGPHPADRGRDLFRPDGPAASPRVRVHPLRELRFPSPPSLSTLS